MAIVYLIHGFVGSGKTTFSKELELKTGAFRFAHDELMSHLYGIAPPKDNFNEYYEKVNQLIWQLTIKLLYHEQDVILDYGFWSRKDRDIARKKIEVAGHKYKLYSIQCSGDKIRNRVLKRTSELPSGSLWINEAAIDEFKKRFEPLTDDEEREEIRTD